MGNWALVDREFRRFYRLPGNWVLALAMAAFAYAGPGPAPLRALLLLVCDLVLAGCTSYRAVADEFEAGTLEALAVTPISPSSILLQLSVAHALRAVTLVLPALVVLVGMDPVDDHVTFLLAMSLKSVAMLPGVVFYVALGAVRGRTWLLGRGDIGWVFGGMVFLTLGLLLAPAWAAMPGLLAVSVLGNATIYSIWWQSEGTLFEAVARPRPRRSRQGGAPRVSTTLGWWSRRPTPDRVSPILWRELEMGESPWQISAQAMFVTVIAAILAAAACNRNTSMVTAGRIVLGTYYLFLGLSVFGVAAWVASRTVADRNRGVTDEILAAPVQPCTYFVGMILGGVVRAFCSMGPPLLLVAAVCVLGGRLDGLLTWTLMAAVAWPLAGSVGCVAGRMESSRFRAVLAAGLFLALAEFAVGYPLLILYAPIR